MTELLEQRKWILFGLLLLCHTFFLQVYPNFIPTNELSRLLLASAVVDDHSVQIDHARERYDRSEDEAQFQGHFYSDKAIGVSLVAIPFLVLLRLIESAFSFHASTQEAISFLRVFSITIPSLLFLPFISRFWLRMRPDGKYLTESLFVFTFGTIAFTYSMQLISHHLLGLLLFYSACSLRLQKEDQQFSSKRLLIAGAANGLALMMEYPAVFPVAMICLYAIYRIRKWKGLFFFAVPIFACGMLMLAYNYAIFGTPFDVTYRHMTGWHNPYHAVGIVGVTIPSFDALYGLLVSRHHGLFFSSPVLILALPGLFFFIRSKEWQIEGWLFSLISFSFLFIYGGFGYWIGGYAFGPRYLGPAIPFLATAAYFAFTDEKILSRNLLRVGTAVAALISIVLITAGSITFPYLPDAFRDPSFFVSLPLLWTGGYGRNLGNWLGLQNSGPALLFFALLIITYLVAKIPSGTFDLPDRASLKNWKLVLPITILLLIGESLSSPTSNAKEFYGRGLVYTFLAKYELALVDMKVALFRNPDHQMKARAERAIVGLNNALQATKK
jgi:hypothetical protein